MRRFRDSLDLPSSSSSNSWSYLGSEDGHDRGDTAEIPTKKPKISKKDESTDELFADGDSGPVHKLQLQSDEQNIPAIKKDAEWIEQLKKEGLIEIVPRTKRGSKYDHNGVPAIIQYRYSDGKPFEHVKCTHCATVLSSITGGHWTKHQKRTCLSGTVNRSKIKECQDSVKNAIVDYCISSGASFRQTESESFRNLLRTCMSSMSGIIPPDEVQLPCRQTIRTMVNTKCIELITQIGHMIKSQVETGDATIVLDFGLHVHNFLSAFVSFIGVDERGDPLLKLLPFCFSPMFSIKTAENVRDELIRCGSRFGLTKEQVLSLGVISDGAANVSSMGKKYFANWSLCSCHALQKMSERILSPKVSNLYHYSTDELDYLELSNRILSKCAKLALMVHKHKRDIRISKLPTLHIETRWQSSVRCAKDILKLLPTLKTCHIPKISTFAEDIDLEKDRLETTIEALDRFDPLVSFFEESTTNIQYYLPLVNEINFQFSQSEMETDDPATRALNKSGRIVTAEYLDKNISEIHIKSTFLTPKLKKMSRISSSYQKTAIDLLKTELASQQVITPQNNDDKKVISSKNTKQFNYLFDDLDDIGAQCVHLTCSNGFPSEYLY